SVLFLVSAYMQLAEAGHGYVRFRPRDLSWWVAVCFVLGSIGFIIGTLPGLEPPGFPTAEQGPGALTVKLGFLGRGIAFLVGSYLMLPELFTQTRAEEYPETAKPRPSGERERCAVTSSRRAPSKLVRCPMPGAGFRGGRVLRLRYLGRHRLPLGPASALGGGVETSAQVKPMVAGT